MLDRDEKKNKTQKTKREGGERNAGNSVYSATLKKKNPKQAKKTTKANNNVNKLRPAKLREITKCLLTRFSQIQVDI